MTCEQSKTDYEALVGTDVDGVTVHHNAYEGTHEEDHEDRCVCTAGFEQARPDRTVCEDIEECPDEDCNAQFMSGGQAESSEQVPVSNWRERMSANAPSGVVTLSLEGTRMEQTCRHAKVNAFSQLNIAKNTCDSDICATRKSDWAALIGTDVDGKVVSHQAYTGTCTSDATFGAVCECESGFSNKGNEESSVCEDISECQGDPCTSEGTRTDTCVERHGTYECECQDQYGEHPTTGGFGDGTDWTTCTPINTCASGICSTLRTEKEGQIGTTVDGLRLYKNPYDDTLQCTDNALYGAICLCTSGNQNVEGLDYAQCVDVPECSPNPCTDKHVTTRTCLEMWGTYECECKSFTQHPLNDDGSTDYTECGVGEACSDDPAPCQAQFDTMEPLVGTEIDGVLLDHNPYDNTCVDHRRYGPVCGCTGGFTNAGFLDSRICNDDEECPGNPCSSSGLYTGTCTEILGTYECNCTDPQGKHPDGGLNGTDWTVCVPGQLCSMGLCDDKFDSFIALVGTNDTDGVYVHHNPYDRSCVDDSQWGATCGCTTGFRNKGTLSALECEDIDECAEDALGSCGANTICTNVLGSWMCQCNFGLEDPAYTASFEGPKNCADINECELGVFRLDGMVSTACNMYAGMCVNSDMLTTGAAYSCLCYDGWEAKAQITDSDIQTGCSDCCEDIDECARGTHQCEETCFQGVVSDPVGTNYTCDCGTQRFLISEISCTGCEYDGWLNWSDCSKDCGLGVKSRVGMVTQPRDDNPFIRKTPQETCVKTQESQCFVDFCKEDLCSYSSWTSWTDCSRPCGGGEMSRERSLSEGESSYCTEPLVETDTCNTQSCTGIMLKVVRHPAFLAGVAAIVLIALVTAGVCIHRHIRIKR